MANLLYLALLFKSFTFWRVLLKLALLGVFPFLPNSKYAPCLLAFNALVVNFLAAALAALNPIPPGTAICVIASVNLPIVLSSAVSSNIFILSKNSSTDDAVSESAPRSISSAPRDITPSGIFIAPDNNPAPKALYQLVSLFVSAEFNDLLSSAI